MTNRRRWSLVWLGGLCVLLGLFLGCTPSAPTVQEEIVIAAPRDLAPGEKDAFYCSKLLSVWEPLIDVDESGEPVGVLATSWESSPDARIWTFHLRQGVTFHDGTPFNAAAVVANLDRIKGVEFRGSQFYNMSLRLMYPSLEHWEAIDDATVRLIFADPMPTLPYLMAGWNSAQFNPRSIDPVTWDFMTTDIGTGPFRLAERMPDQYVKIVRNDHYWGVPAQAETIRVRVIPDAQTRFSAMMAEEIVGVVDLGAMTPALAQELVRDDRFVRETAPSTITHYLTLQGKQGIFVDSRMKRAVSLMVDRQAIVDNYFYGQAVPTENLINSQSPFGRIVSPCHDSTAAVALAREVLEDRRVPVRLVISQSSCERYPYKEMAEWIQAELRPLGLDVEIIVLDGAAVSQILRKGDYEMTLHIRGLSSRDPADLFWEWLSDDERGLANISRSIGYANPAVQAELVQIASAQTLQDRRQVYNRLQEMVLEDPVTVPLFEDTTLLVHHRKLEGFHPTSYGVTLAETHWAK